MSGLLPSLIPTVPGLKANCALAYTITLPEKPTIDQPTSPHMVAGPPGATTSPRTGLVGLRECADRDCAGERTGAPRHPRSIPCTGQDRAVL